MKRPIKHSNTHPGSKHRNGRLYSTAALEGRAAFVAGTGGIGSAISDAFSRAGADVVTADKSANADIRADLATGDGVERAVAAALHRLGRVDTLVLATGVQHVAPVVDFPEERWQELIAVMLTGPFLLLKGLWTHLINEEQGRVIALGSVSSSRAEPFKAAYVAAKHGLAGLMKVAAVEGASHGLTANTIAPGWVRTPMVEAQLEDQMRLRDLSRAEVIEQVMLARQPLKRFVEPEEVAQLATFLASRMSASITGAVIAIDGGWEAT